MAHWLIALFLVADAGTAEPFVQDIEDDLVDFHFSWSAEAAQVPDLVARLDAERAKQLAELQAVAEEERVLRNRDKYGYSFTGFERSTEYSTAGQSPRLLSLSVKVSAYTGGAHGNHGTGAFLWDYVERREIGATDLFERPAAFPALVTANYCNALYAERTKRNGEQTGTVYEMCPSLSELAIIPSDSDGDHLFDRIHLIAAPYVAGSYAEGEYDIPLQVTPAIVAALKPDYRASFEAQSGQ